MANEWSQKTKLSKNILQMKFMQKTAIRVDKEENADEQKRLIDDEHWVLDIPELKEKESQYLIEPSLIKCDCLKFGRMSFKGFNPEIEKLMRKEDAEQELDISEQREKEISVNDEQMAERYESLVGTIAKKFSKKRHRSSPNEEPEDQSSATEQDGSKKKKRKKFLKPQDD